MGLLRFSIYSATDFWNAFYLGEGLGCGRWCVLGLAAGQECRWTVVVVGLAVAGLIGVAKGDPTLDGGLLYLCLLFSSTSFLLEEFFFFLPFPGLLLFLISLQRRRWDFMSSFKELVLVVLKRGAAVILLKKIPGARRGKAFLSLPRVTQSIYKSDFFPLTLIGN